MEKQVIQSVGFRNIKDENGNVTGFQFKVRLPYYRGIFLSQIRPGTLYIDGEKIEKDDIVWNIKGEDFTNEEMRTDFQTHWAVTCPAVLKVKKPGGLAQGYHGEKARRTRSGLSRSKVWFLLHILLHAAHHPGTPRS